MATKKTKSSTATVPDSEKDSWLVKISAFLFMLGIIYLVIAGYIIREEQRLNPKWDSQISFLSQSQGYFLGLIGGSLMLFILLYPARKHLKPFHRIGPVKFWYRLHIIIGLSAPTLVLFHANFLYGGNDRSISINDLTVFYAMLAVVVSGIIGRFFYRQVHSTLTQHHYTLSQMREYMINQRKVFDHHVQMTDKQVELIGRFEEYMRRRSSFWGRLFALPFIRLRSKKMARLLKRSIRHQIYTSPEGKNMERRQKIELMRKYKHMIDTYFMVIRRANNFAFYERLFSIWYLLHFPLYIVLIFLGILHVVAVHAY